MALVLIDVALSPFAQKVKIALREKNIPFEIRGTDLTTADPVRAANPRGEIPLLLDGDAAVWDSSIILEYIEDKWPEPALLPKDPLGRARARQIEELCDGPFEAVIFCTSEVTVFRRAQGELQAAILAEAKNSLQQLFAYLEQQLGDKPYFGGEAWGRADCAVFPHVMNARGQRTPPPEGSKLAAWLTRALERPSVQQTMAEAKAGIAEFKAMAEAYAGSQAKRQYRDYRLDWMLRAGGVSIVQEGLAKGNIRFGGLIG